MITVWYSRPSVITFLGNLDITVDAYWYQLDEMHIPHAAAPMTVSKLAELQMETPRHQLYSPDLRPLNYHLFQNLNNFSSGKKFNSTQANNWIISTQDNFYITKE